MYKTWRYDHEVGQFRKSIVLFSSCKAAYGFVATLMYNCITFMENKVNKLTI